MTAEQKTSPPVTRSLALNPWYVFAAALIVYALAMNRWVTLRGLPWIAGVAGWDWHPFPTEWRANFFAPLWYVLTFPIRALPVDWRPPALTFFSAACAAGTLALLSMSIRLLPHDRTREQRRSEQGEFSLLSGKWAFVPQLLAVLVLGVYGVFWDNAVNPSSESLDALVFAFLIYCLLRFRVTQSERWLLGMSFAYGLGVTNNFALIGFFPLFLIALIWAKGMSFFNLRFIARMTGCGAAGLLLYLLLPLAGSLPARGEPFWTLLLREWKQQSFLLLRVTPGWIALVAGLSSIAPLLCAAFRWPEVEGELSAAGHLISKFGQLSMNVLFLPVALLVFFDWRFSTNPKIHDAPTSFLTFYYLAALAAGYYAGYILVVFGKARPRYRESRSLLNYAAVALVWIFLIAAPGWLLYTGWGRITNANNGILQRFTAQTIAALPDRPSIVLSDDPIRLQLLEAGYRKSGRINPHILLESSSLPHGDYFAYLVQRYPQLKPRMMAADKIPKNLDSGALVDFLYQLGRQYPIYYLHPSFGYYFETFYLRPHRLVYEMKLYPSNTFLPPPPSPAEIKENEDFWSSIKQSTLDPLPRLAAADWDATRVSIDYSVALDFWGVELQRANRLKEARAAFAGSYRLNTNNLMAKYNLEFNDRLQRGDPRPMDQSDTLQRALALYRSVPTIIKYNGPPDEPFMDMVFGQILAEGGNLRQAAGLFERRLQFMPNDVPAKLAVAKTLVDTGQADRALKVTREIRALTNSLPDELFWVEAVAYLTKTNFAEAERSLLQGQQQAPSNPLRLANVVEFYRRSGLAAFRAGHREEGTLRLKKALNWVNQFIQLINSDHAAAAVFNQADVLLAKADIEVALSSWNEAAQTLEHILQIDPENVNALLNHSLVLVRLKNYRVAKEDADNLLKLLPQQPYMAYGAMIAIAKAENDAQAQKKYMRLYLKSAPPASSDYANMKKEFEKLGGS